MNPRILRLLFATLAFATLASPRVMAQTASFSDSFNSLDLARWEILGGSWAVAGGQVTGSWDQSDAQSDQGNLLLRGGAISGNYTAEYVASLVAGQGLGFSLYQSAGNKYNVYVDRSSVSIQRRLNGNDYTVVASQNFSALAAGATATVRLTRTGTSFAVAVNGAQILTFGDSQWSGNLRLGLSVYGTAAFDSFTYTLGTTPPATDPGGRGEVSFILTWGFDASDEGPDIDLHVIDPSGTEWNYTTQGSAHFDLDDRGASGPGDGAGPERAYWDPAVVGTYSYFARWFAGTGSAATYADATIRVYRRSNGVQTLVDTKTVRLTNAARDSQRWTYAVTATPTVSYSLSSISASYNSTGGSGSIGVTVSGGTGPWTATSNVSWLTVTSGDSGTTSGTVSYSVAANTSTSIRQGTLTIAGQTFTVSQSGATVITYTLGSSSASFGSGVGSGSVAVTVSGGTGSWTANSNASWLTVTSGGSGTSSGTVGYSVAANTSTSSRQGTLIIAGQTFTVSQSAPTVVTYSLGGSSASFGSGGGGGGVTVTVSGGTGSWTATSNTSWLTVTSGGSGTSSGTVNYSVAANTSTSSRQGTLTVAGQAFTVSQGGIATVAGTLRMSALSTRVFVGSGENVLITGLSLIGSGSKNFVVRGVGPALTGLGVPGALADPIVTVYDSRGAILARNDNWDSSLASVFSSVGLFPLPIGGRDAALSIILSEGSYTFMVSGSGSSTGVALVEVYELP